MSSNIVIDSDVGTDVDDLFALTYALRSPCEVNAITTVQGDTKIRAKIVRKLQRLLGTDVKMFAGFAGDYESVRKYWTGIEKRALTKEESEENFQSNGWPEYDTESKIVCIGPLTNIAYQLENNPSIQNVKTIYLMGGHEGSHNLKADFNSWRKVRDQSWEIYHITKEVSKKIFFDKNELEEIRRNPIGEFLYESAIRWLNYTQGSWIDHSRESVCAMYDVLAVSSSIGEGYVQFRKESENRFFSYDVDLKLKEKLKEIILK